MINTEVTTGAQVVSNINDAISSNGAKSASWKPADSARVPTPKSSTWKNSEPTSPKLDKWKPPEASRVPSPKLPTKPKPFDAPRSTSPKNVEPEAVTSPKPVSPKPEVQKFAPTWHSVQHHYVDKEREYHRTLSSPLSLTIPPFYSPRPFWNVYWHCYKLCCVSPCSNLCSYSKNLSRGKLKN